MVVEESILACDAMAKDIVDQAMAPAVHRGDFVGGLRAGLLKLMEQARRYQISDPARPPRISSRRIGVVVNHTG